MKTGDVLRLWEDPGEGMIPQPISNGTNTIEEYTQRDIRVVIDEKKRGIYTLAAIDEPYIRFRVRDDGRIESSDLVGKNSFFEIEEVSKGEILIKGIIKSKDTSGSTTLFVYPHNGALVSSFSPKTVKYEVERLSLVTLMTTSKTIFAPLEAWQKRRFLHEGYLHIPAGVSKSKANKCQRLLMHHLGIPGAIVAGGAQDALGKLVGSLSNSVEIRELLLGERIMCIVEDLMGGHNNIDSITNLSAQIALRFPELSAPGKVKWHTDGLRQGKTHGFSLLVGVCLSDVNEEDSGNLLVWPGTHVPIHEATVGEEGSLDIPQLISLLHTYRLCPTSQPTCSPTLQTTPPINHHDNDPENLPDLGRPFQLLSQVGDVVILHPDTAHTGGPNSSCSIRSMVYFRLKHRNLKDHDSLYRDNMWIDLPGIFEYS